MFKEKKKYLIESLGIFQNLSFLLQTVIDDHRHLYGVFLKIILQTGGGDRRKLRVRMGKTWCWLYVTGMVTAAAESDIR